MINQPVRLTIRDDVSERYEKDIELMQRMYLEAERQFIEFNLIVPYVENDDNVYSPRLVSLLQIIGSQIDGILKILAGLLSIDIQSLLSLGTKEPSFTHYTRILDRYGMLTAQEIRLNETSKVIMPFKFNENHTTDWRIALNATKHDLPQGAYCGRYGHVVNSLAALAILHELVYTSTHDRFRSYILNEKNWANDGADHLDMGYLTGHDFCREKSKVFTYRMRIQLTEPTLVESLQDMHAEKDRINHY